MGELLQGLLDKQRLMVASMKKFAQVAPVEIAALRQHSLNEILTVQQLLGIPDDGPRFTVPLNSYRSTAGVNDPAVTHPILVQILFASGQRGFGATSLTLCNCNVADPKLVPSHPGLAPVICNVRVQDVLPQPPEQTGIP